MSRWRWPAHAHRGAQTLAFGAGAAARPIPTTAGAHACMHDVGAPSMATTTAVYYPARTFSSTGRVVRWPVLHTSVGSLPSRGRFSTITITRPSREVSVVAGSVQ